MGAASTSDAQTSAAPSPIHFNAVPGGRHVVKPVTLPIGLRGPGRVTVVVQMSEDSIASMRARTPDHSISAAERQNVVARVAAQHSSIESAITARGGTVLNHFHAALNGIKINIDKKELAGLAALPGVVQVLPVRVYRRQNSVAVPFTGAPLVWQGTPGFRGEHIKIASIDTGIDYTHADFGGPGTADAYNAALATDTAPANPLYFGPRAPKVKGGYDFAGDAYDAGDPTTVPQPDPNPLDCDGHGTHTAGTAAGFGVALDGNTYHGPYDSAAYTTGFLVGPGVAPKADLYELKVFGCSGLTNLVTEAIDWAVENDMDVITMSLGASFGNAALAYDADGVAATNAVAAGIVVAAASGNDGPIPYIVSDPSAGDGVISVAATDARPTFPGVVLLLNTGKSINAQNSNSAPLPGSVPIFVLPDGSGGVSFGCNPADYAVPGVAGALVVTLRGGMNPDGSLCARITKAQLGQQAGAAAVAMINNTTGYPPFEGPIPDVTIPFLGVLATDQPTLTAATAVKSFTTSMLANPGFAVVTTFSSGGPRYGDSILKPNTTADGTAVVSALLGSGNQGVSYTGTSMATPQVAGIGALAVQAHREWNAAAVSQAVIQASVPARLGDYAPRLEGAGLAQAVGAVRTQAVVFGQGASPNPLSFGFNEFTHNFAKDSAVDVVNQGAVPIVFDVTATKVGGVPHQIRLGQTSVFVPAHGTARLDVTVSIPAATVGTTHDSAGNDVYEEVAGYLSFKPQSSFMNGGATLHVPYYLVPRARSNVFAVPLLPLSPRIPKSELALTNILGAVPGTADLYSWGLSSAPQGLTYFDVRAVGVQSDAVPFLAASDRLLVFAVNTHTRFSYGGVGEFDVFIDNNGDGIPEYEIFSFDLGLVTTGVWSGQVASFVVNLATGATFAEFIVDAPNDGSTALLAVDAVDVGVSAANPRFSYTADAYDPDGTYELVPGSASFNAFSPSITSGVTDTIAPNKVALQAITVNPQEWQKTPALGLMVVVEDNASGAKQATLLPAH